MIKDNSAYLIGQIKKDTDKMVQEIQDQYKKDLQALKKEYSSSKELVLLEQSLKKQRDAFVVQQENMFRLRKDQERLKAISVLVDEVLIDVKKKLLSASFIKLVIEQLGGKDCKNIQVPKGVTLQGSTKRDDNKVVADLPSGVQVEFDIDDFLNEQKSILFEVVSGQL